MDGESDYTLARGVELLDLPTAGDVARLLRAAGVKQRPGQPHTCNCPVSVFLEGFVGEPVSATRRAARLVANSPVVEDSWVDLPESADRFIRRFDSGDPEFDDLRDLRATS